VEIVPGLHWVDAIWDAKVYILCEDDGAVIVDSGMPGREKAIWRHLDLLGYVPGDVRQIWLTHGDIDHAGSAAALKARAGAEIVAHREDIALVEGRAGRALGPVRGAAGLERLFNWAIARVLRYTPAQVDQPVKDGDELGAWRVVHTPGHTPGSVCFHDAQRGILIAGDALRHRRGNLLPPPRLLAPALAASRASVSRIAALDFEICCFGHGAPLVGDASARVRRLAGSLS
jgi:glyoxylase-like metal-dependent hydrolase (beta-lactamase superfamily II)